MSAGQLSEFAFMGGALRGSVRLFPHNGQSLPLVKSAVWQSLSVFIRYLKRQYATLRDNGCMLCSVDRAKIEYFTINLVRRV